MTAKQKTAGQRLIESAQEALRFARGEDVGAIVWQVETLDVAEVRNKLGLSQDEFARKFRISLGTLRNWEQGVRKPEGPARVLLQVIAKEPEAVERALDAYRPKRVAAELGPQKSARKRAVAATAKPPKRRRKRV